MMHTNYDVIIIGAGPAGLNCARFLQDRNLKVLLLEKNKVIGPKVCAGGLTQKDMEYLKLPTNVIGRSFDKIIYQAQLISTEIEQNRPIIYTVDRADLGQWQLSQLDQNKVDIITGSEVCKISPEYIKTVSGATYSYKHLVGTDGSASLVRRYLKLKTKILGVGIQYIIKDHKLDQLELHYQPKFFGAWYAWIFPHKNFVSVGTGGDPRRIPPHQMRKNLEAWMHKKNIDYSQGKFEAFPINNDYRGFEFDNIYLAGDAAGLASEFNGEGIYQALISGEEIAKIIIDPKYSAKKLERVLKSKNRHAKVLNFLEHASIFRPLIMEIIGLGFRSNYLTKKAFKYVLD